MWRRSVLWTVIILHSVNGTPIHVIKEQIVAVLINPGCSGTQIFTLNNPLCVKETIEEVGELLK